MYFLYLLVCMFVVFTVEFMNLFFRYVSLDALQDVHIHFAVILFRQDSKAVLNCSFNKSARYDCYVSDFYYKIYPQYFSTAILYLSVPSQTQYISAISPSDARHKPVRIAETALYGELYILCNIQHGNCRMVKV